MDEKCYVAVCPECRRLVAACVPDARERAKEVGSWLRDGLSVELSDDEVRNGQWGHTPECTIGTSARKRTRKVTA